jgi:hypothetical protein
MDSNAIGGFYEFAHRCALVAAERGFLKPNIRLCSLAA